MALDDLFRILEWTSEQGVGTAADKSQNSPVNAFAQGQDAPKRYMPNSHTCTER